MQLHSEHSGQATAAATHFRIPLPRLPLRIPQRKILLTSVDIALLNGALLVGLHFSLDTPLSLGAILDQFIWFAALTVLWLVIAPATDSYDLRRAAKAPRSISAVLKALFLSGVILSVLALLFSPLSTILAPILVVGALSAGALVLWRVAYAVVLVQPRFRRRALLVGAGWAGSTMVQALKSQNPGYEVAGYVDDDEAKQGRVVEGIPVLGKCTDLTALIGAHNVSDIILAVTHHMHADLVQTLVKCFEQGVRIVSMPELYGQITGRIPVEHIGDRWLVSLPLDRDSGGFYPIAKRAMDIFISGTGLLGLALVLPFLALALYLDSPGPIFYRAERLGRGGKTFRVWKLRTMVPDADRIGDPTFTGKDDDRITRVGRILRATHVDEFPQFINILKGEMSAVGPRPERYVPEFEETIPFYRARYAVKPGMAGWGLVKQGYAEGAEDTLIKLQYDLYYIKHRSISLDILILAKTAIDMVTFGGR